MEQKSQNIVVTHPPIFCRNFLTLLAPSHQYRLSSDLTPHPQNLEYAPCGFFRIMYVIKTFIIHLTNSPYNFFIQNCPQFGLQSSKRCMIKLLRNTRLCSIKFFGTEMKSDRSNYHREYSPDGSYFLFQHDGPTSFLFYQSRVRKVLKEVPLLAILTRNISSNFFP